MFTRIISLLLCAINAIFGWVGLPAFPAAARTLNLDKFALVWSDEFDGDSLDLDVWGWNAPVWGGEYDEPHRHNDGYWCLDMAQVRDGELHIKSAFLEDGLRGLPAGYYTAGLDTSKAVRQKYGYFEARCKLPKGQGLWSAFWLCSEQVWNGAPDGSGQDGTEIDIYESAYYKDCWPLKNSVSSALHYDGYGDAHRTQDVGRWFVEKPYDSFHTYGLEWNEDGYIFYIDGRETGRSSFGGVCRSELYLLLTVEHEFGTVWSGDIRENAPGEITDFVVDYVRVYQYVD